MNAFKRLKQWLLSKLDRQLADNEIALSQPGQVLQMVSAEGSGGVKTATIECLEARILSGDRAAEAGLEAVRRLRELVPLLERAKIRVVEGVDERHTMRTLKLAIALVEGDEP